MFTQPITFTQLPIPLSEFNLADDLLIAEQLTWVEHVNTDEYQGKWDVLELKVPKEHRYSHRILQAFAIEAACEWIDGPNLELLSAFESLLASLECEILSARLMRLHPNSFIKPHRDNGLCIEKSQQARIHICLGYSANIEFYVDGHRVPMSNNSAWYINADAVHSVKNAGSTPRINLVVDCKVNDWLKGLIWALHDSTQFNVNAGGCDDKPAFA